MTRLTFDFVSDVSCPYCLAAFLGLEIALERLADLVEPEIRFHPYQLNPAMPPAGETLAANLNRKFGMTAEAVRDGCTAMRARAAGLGFSMNYDEAAGIYNTFDAHRLLHWAGLEGRQVALKRALLTAYFGKRLSPADPGVLIDAAQAAGLDPEAAREVLTSGRYIRDVLNDEQQWRARDVRGVPFITINGRYVINGSQTPEGYERVLRQIAAEASA